METKHQRLLRMEEKTKNKKFKLTEWQIQLLERLYANKLPVTAVQVMNNDVLPFFEEPNIKVKNVLTDNGREYCGRPDYHPFECFCSLG